jgi:hypothetical protein
MRDLLVSTFRLLKDLHSIATKLFQVDNPKASAILCYSLGPNALAAQADGKASDSFPQAERLGNTLRLFSAYPNTKTSPDLEQGTKKLTPKPMRGFFVTVVDR